MQSRKPKFKSRGFTLVETMVVIGIIIVISVISFNLLGRVRERARWVGCVGNMRQIGAAMVARAVENNERLYSQEEVGKSSYRQWRDPLSLCQILVQRNFLEGEKVWMSPGASKSLKPFKNSYAWTVNSSLLATPMSAVENPHTKVLLWNNYCYTLPSPNNVPEASPGPKPASKSFYAYPWNKSKDANWLYLDLHIETF